MADTFAAADCAFLLNPKNTESGAASIADWEFDDFSVGSACSGLSELISRQSSDTDAFNDPPSLQSFQSISSAVSPFAAAKGAPERPQQGLITCSAESMDWARACAAKAAAEVEADGTAGKKKKDVPPAAKRTRRREQQKVAQQRYRQKQRHWAADAEVKVDELAEQQQEIKAQRAELSSRKATLEGNVKRLEANLADRTAQVAALRKRLAASRPAKEASEARAAENPTVVAASAQRLLDSVAALRAYVQQHISEEGACDQSMGLQELQQLLAAHQIADAALHSSSPVQEGKGVGNCVPAEAAHVPTAKQQEAIVKALRLTPVQRNTLTWIKERQLNKIAALADARRELSMKAMSQMLPTLRLTSAGLDEHLGGLSLASGLAASREVAAFDVAISDIKANIAEERQAAAELEDLVMHRALTPLQAAVFVVESFPSRPDGFALIDAVTTVHGWDKSTVISGVRQAV